MAKLNPDISRAAIANCRKAERKLDCNSGSTNPPNITINAAKTNPCRIAYSAVRPTDRSRRFLVERRPSAPSSQASRAEIAFGTTYRNKVICSTPSSSQRSQTNVSRCRRGTARALRFGSGGKPISMPISANATNFRTGSACVGGC